MPRGAGLRMLAALGAARALVLPRRCAARSLIRYATETERGAPKLPKGAFRPKQSLGQNYLQDPNYAARARRLVSQKFGGLRRFHAIFMNRLQERRRWVVSFPILSLGRSDRDGSVRTGELLRVFVVVEGRRVRPEPDRWF